MVATPKDSLCSPAVHTPDTYHTSVTAELFQLCWQRGFGLWRLIRTYEGGCLIDLVVIALVAGAGTQARLSGSMRCLGRGGWGFRREGPARLLCFGTSAVERAGCN